MPRITINGQPHTVAQNTSVAAALMNLGITSRSSVQGEARNPLCGMGICFECRVTVNGIAHQRGCQIEAVEGMEVSTNAL
jgi:predicted molibdopterin-dependent oxidoreductase YjgC